MTTPTSHSHRVAHGRRIGARAELSFAPVIAQKFRLNVIESKLIWPTAGVTVDEFELFAN